MLAENLLSKFKVTAETALCRTNLSGEHAIRRKCKNGGQHDRSSERRTEAPRAGLQEKTVCQTPDFG